MMLTLETGLLTFLVENEATDLLISQEKLWKVVSDRKSSMGKGSKTNWGMAFWGE